MQFFLTKDVSLHSNLRLAKLTLMVLLSQLLLSGCGLQFTFVGNWGFIDRTGKLVIPAQFSEVGAFSGGLALVAIGEFPSRKWGYVSRDGKLTIPTSFDNAHSFSEGLAAVKSGKKWGFINQQGKYVIEPVYDDANSFSEGLAMVEQSEIWFCLDKSGKRIFQLEKGCWPGDFSEGLAHVEVPLKEKEGAPVDSQSDGLGPPTRVGFIDKTGKFVIPPKYDKVEKMRTPDIYGPSKAFSHGVALVEVGPWNDTGNWKWGIINRKGEYIVKPGFSSFARFLNQGYASVLLGGSSGRWGFVDFRGRVFADSRFQTPDGFSDGLALAELSHISHKLGYVDTQGKLVIEPKYDRAGRFSEGLACVKFGNKLMLIDKTGAPVADLNYGFQRVWEIFLPEFHEGLAPVCLGNYGPA